MFASRFKFNNFMNIQNFYKNSRRHYIQETIYLHNNLKSFFDISIGNKISGRMGVY